MVAGLTIERLGRVPYHAAWALQRTRHEQIVAGAAGDTLLLLEHDSVYTAGRRTEPGERPQDPAVEVVDVDRGGKITWHGPGQLVGYPLLRLPAPLDVVQHVRRLEDLVQAVCEEAGLATSRVPGRSGVWTADGQRKVAAVGVRVAQGVTLHGFALNVEPDLTAFGRIVPCGITDATVTSLAAELGVGVPLGWAEDAVVRHAALLVGPRRALRHPAAAERRDGRPAVAATAPAAAGGAVGSADRTVATAGAAT